MSRRSSRLDFLDRTAGWMCRRAAMIANMRVCSVEEDIRLCWREATFGRDWAMRRDRIQAELEKKRTSEAAWTKRETGIDISEMRRRARLFRKWDRYATARRAAGFTGQSGLYFGLSLIPDRTGSKTERGSAPVRSDLLTGTAAPSTLDLTRCTFITGDALIELRKMKSKSVQCIITSPPYFPLRRLYSGEGIAYEATVAEYIASLVAIFREARRVLRDDGTLWIVIGDSYSTSGGVWQPDSLKARRPTPQKDVPAGVRYQSTVKDRPLGNLLMIPARVALALQDDGWILRQDIVWKKSNFRPECVEDRCTRAHEMVYMFTKQRRDYNYDPDPVRIPLAKPSTTAGRQKAGMLRRDGHRDFRIWSNPMGRNAESVWEIPTGGYKGEHAAVFPPELVRRMVEISCDGRATVLDPMGGAGTVAMVAVQLGHRAISIDIDPKATEEALQRCANAPAFFTLPEIAAPVYTPRSLAKRIIDHFRPVGRVLDPCKGDGAFFDQLPSGTEWCEVRLGRDFFHWMRDEEWIISNPPWRSEEFRPFLQHALDIADNVVFLCRLHQACGTYARLRDAMERGHALKEILVVPWPDEWGSSGFILAACHWQRGWTGGTQWTVLQEETALAVD